MYDNLPRLPDPNTTPAGPGFVSQTLTNNTPGMMHPLNSGESVSVKFAGDYWTINVSYPQLTIAEGNNIFPFLYSLQGTFTNFYIQLPTMANPQTGVWDTSSNISIAKGSITAVAPNKIRVPSWSTRGGNLSAGDLIKFDNSNKIFLVSIVELASDIMLLTLSSDIPDTTILATAGLEPNDIRFKVRMTTKAPSAQLTADGLYQSFSLALRENTY